MVVGIRPKVHFDAETRRIRRASRRIITLCKFEQNREGFTEGILEALRELKL